jgi:hypothetical protein
VLTQMMLPADDDACFFLLLGTLKAKIAKLKSELINGPGGKSAGSKDAGRGFEGGSVVGAGNGDSFLASSHHVSDCRVWIARFLLSTLSLPLSLSGRHLHTHTHTYHSEQIG